MSYDIYITGAPRQRDAEVWFHPDWTGVSTFEISFTSNFSHVFYEVIDPVRGLKWFHGRQVRRHLNKLAGLVVGLIEHVRERNNPVGDYVAAGEQLQKMIELGARAPQGYWYISS